MSSAASSNEHGLHGQGSDWTARLAKIDTCVLSDALDRLQIRGVAFGLSRLAGVRSSVAGRVITVTLGPAQGDVAPRHLCTAAVEQGGPGDVIVVEHHAHPQAAGWGGILLGRLDFIFQGYKPVGLSHSENIIVGEKNWLV